MKTKIRSGLIGSGTRASGLKGTGYEKYYYCQIRRQKMNKQIVTKISDYLRDYLVITLGSSLVAVSVNLCLANYNLAFGGVTGISIIVEELFGISLNYTYYALSFFLLLLGGFTKGKDFFFKTLFSITAISFIFLPCTKGLQSFSLNIFIAALSGAALLGTGVGIILRSGGSTSGPDLVAALLRRRIPEKYTLLLIDSGVFIWGVIVFGFFSNIYALIVLFLTPTVVGIVLEPRKLLGILTRIKIWGRKKPMKGKSFLTR
jgi:uncharacterized membrane-anchored protein YitT (DUF2179 family)